MTKVTNDTKKNTTNKPKGMSDHPHGSLSVPENKLVGGESIFEVSRDMSIASPDLQVPPGQTTHE